MDTLLANCSALPNPARVEVRGACPGSTRKEAPMAAHVGDEIMIMSQMLQSSESPVLTVATRSSCSSIWISTCHAYFSAVRRRPTAHRSALVPG